VTLFEYISIYMIKCLIGSYIDEQRALSSNDAEAVRSESSSDENQQ
jgi:hypothetical protein